VANIIVGTTHLLLLKQCGSNKHLPPPKLLGGACDPDMTRVLYPPVTVTGSGIRMYLKLGQSVPSLGLLTEIRKEVHIIFC